MDDITIQVSTDLAEVTVTVAEGGLATIPPAFEARVADLEDFKLNGTINGGIIM